MNLPSDAEKVALELAQWASGGVDEFISQNPREVIALWAKEFAKEIEKFAASQVEAEIERAVERAINVDYCPFVEIDDFDHSRYLEFIVKAIRNRKGGV